MINDSADRTRNARVAEVDTPPPAPTTAGKTYRCQVFLYARGFGYLAVAAALPGVAGMGPTEAEALSEVTRAFKAIIPEHLSHGRIPWLEQPVGPEHGGLVRWVFPEI